MEATARAPPRAARLVDDEREERQLRDVAHEPAVEQQQRRRPPLAPRAPRLDEARAERQQRGQAEEDLVPASAPASAEVTTTRACGLRAPPHRRGRARVAYERPSPQR